MTFKQFQNLLKGKIFIVGISFINKEGELIEQYQTYGSVLELTSDGFIKLLRNDKSVFQLPYYNEAIESGQKEAYKLTSTNEVINDPDFIMTWEIITTDDDNFDQIKEFGFLP